MRLLFRAGTFILDHVKHVPPYAFEDLTRWLLIKAILLSKCASQKGRTVNCYELRIGSFSEVKHCAPVPAFALFVLWFWRARMVSEN